MSGQSNAMYRLMSTLRDDNDAGIDQLLNAIPPTHHHAVTKGGGPFSSIRRQSTVDGRRSQCDDPSGELPQTHHGTQPKIEDNGEVKCDDSKDNGVYDHSQDNRTYDNSKDKTIHYVDNSTTQIEQSNDTDMEKNCETQSKNMGKLSIDSFARLSISNSPRISKLKRKSSTEIKPSKVRLSHNTLLRSSIAKLSSSVIPKLHTPEQAEELIPFETNQVEESKTSRQNILKKYLDKSTLQRWRQVVDSSTSDSNQRRQRRLSSIQLQNTCSLNQFPRDTCQLDTSKNHQSNRCSIDSTRISTNRKDYRRPSEVSKRAQYRLGNPIPKESLLTKEVMEKQEEKFKIEMASLNSIERELKRHRRMLNASSLENQKQRKAILDRLLNQSNPERNNESTKKIGSIGKGNDSPLQFWKSNDGKNDTNESLRSRRSQNSFDIYVTSDVNGIKTYEPHVQSRRLKNHVQFVKLIGDEGKKFWDGKETHTLYDSVWCEDALRKSLSCRLVDMYGHSRE